MMLEAPALAEADAAMAAFAAAQASGDVVAVSLARGRLLKAKDGLARLKVERFWPRRRRRIVLAWRCSRGGCSGLSRRLGG